MTVLLVINSLGSGGAERVLANLVKARESAPVPITLHLALLDDEPRMRTIEPIDALHVLDSRRGLLRSIRQLRKLVRAIRPDVTASFLIRANCANIVAMHGLGGRCVISERMHTASHLSLQNGGGLRERLFRAAVAWLYPRADRVIAVSEGVRANLVDEFGVAPARIATLPNPYDLTSIEEAGRQEPEIVVPGDFCMTIGRLVEAKNTEAVIRAFARTRPTASLVIAGTGPQEQRLREIAREEGCEDAVKFAGYLANPFAVLSRAKFYVSASRNEGFPNAAAEAMALGVPVIHTDCPSGPRELLDGGRFGLLVPMDDPAALRDAMARFAQADIRASYARCALERSRAFDIAEVGARYWGAILESGEAEQTSR